MRQIASFPQQAPAVRFAYYLASVGVPCKTDPERDGFGVWVYDEDDAARARTELAGFLANPADPKYPAAQPAPLAGHGSAGEQAEPATTERVEIGALSQARVTCLLIAASVAITLWTGFGQIVARSNDLWIASVHAQGNTFAWDGLSDIFSRGEVWRLVTPIFIHMGWPHLIFNMMALVELGRFVETLRGSVRYTLLVLVLAVISNLAQYQFGGPRFDYFGPLFGGMSGVLYGLFGYIWMKSWLDPTSELVLRGRAVLMMLGWFVACIIGVIPHVANMAHAGGLAAGMAIGVASAEWSRMRG